MPKIDSFTFTEIETCVEKSILEAMKDEPYQTSLKLRFSESSILKDSLSFLLVIDVLVSWEEYNENLPLFIDTMEQYRQKLLRIQHIVMSEFLAKWCLQIYTTIETSSGLMRYSLHEVMCSRNKDEEEVKYTSFLA